MNLRHKIIHGLAKLPKGSQDLFYKMYGSVEEIADDKLPWALTQVENTITKFKKRANERPTKEH